MELNLADLALSNPEKYHKTGIIAGWGVTGEYTSLFDDGKSALCEGREVQTANSCESICNVERRSTKKDSNADLVVYVKIAVVEFMMS